MTDRRKLKGLTSEEWTDAAIKSLPDESFKTLVLTVATLFKALKAEAVRRGLWEEFRGVQP